MLDHKILLALSIISSPLAPPSTLSNKTSVETAAAKKFASDEIPSRRTAVRRMKHLAAQPLCKQAEYIRPSSANHIDAPMPFDAGSTQIVGIYGNILYPQDWELKQKSKLFEWFENDSLHSNAPFPLSPEELTDISVFSLQRFPFFQIISKRFALNSQRHFIDGQSLERLLDQAKKETLLWTQTVIRKIPPINERYKILIDRLKECSDQAEKLLDSIAKEFKKNPEEALRAILEKKCDAIAPPLHWEMRVGVFKQMVEKVTSLSPNAPYFLALQEITPQALYDLKQSLKEKDLQWISFNNITGTETLAPRQEEVFGEAGGFTSTLALSRDLKVLKVELGDLPSESGSKRAILGVRVLNTRTNETFTIFTTHTDHQIQNDLYAKTAAQIAAFAAEFFQDDPDNQKFILGGDLNAFEQLEGAKYIDELRKRFEDSKDFRETDYYAPKPIAWNTFIGRTDGPFSPSIAEDGTMEPNALDQVIVGRDIELQSAAREAGIYNESGRLLDYYEDRDEYIAQLQKRIAFSDHFFSIPNAI